MLFLQAADRSTRPCKVISPVIAMFFFTARPVIALKSAVAIRDACRRAVFGVGPSGT